MTEELWKWYDRFTKRLHILCIGKHFIEILSGVFKKITAVDSQYKFPNKIEFSYRKQKKKKGCIDNMEGKLLSYLLPKQKA